MGFTEAVEVLRAYAACQIVNGCDLCPMYSTNEDRKEQQAKCQDALTKERVTEALKTLERASV